MNALFCCGCTLKPPSLFVGCATDGRTLRTDGSCFSARSSCFTSTLCFGICLHTQHSTATTVLILQSIARRCVLTLLTCPILGLELGLELILNGHVAHSYSSWPLCITMSLHNKQRLERLLFHTGIRFPFYRTTCRSFSFAPLR